MLETHIGRHTERRAIYAPTVLRNQEATEINDWHAMMAADEIDSIIAQRLAWAINLSDTNGTIKWTNRLFYKFIFFS